ncbi:MAG: hypothetical protein ABH864_03000 [archaeon]
MASIGYNHGRFQLLHNRHLNTFLRILDRFDQIWIGIANPLRTPVPNMDQLDPGLQKSLRQARDPDNNPYSFVERYRMIWDSLELKGIDMSRVKIVPHFGFYETDNWKDFMPEGATVILAAKDYHHYAKVEAYRKNGFKVEFEEPLPGISGTMLREAWPNGNWREMVPEGTRKILESKL